MPSAVGLGLSAMQALDAFGGTGPGGLYNVSGFGGGSFGVNQMFQTREEQFAREQIALQREFAQHGVRWRVEDAVAAGLHPLFALGANVPQFSPVSMAFPQVVGSRRGESGGFGDAARAVASFAESYYRQEALAAAAESERRLRSSQADYYDALAAKERQSLNAQPPVPDSVVRQGNIGLTGRGDPMFNTVEIKAAPTFSRAEEVPQSMAGSKPMWQPWQLRANGLMMDVPWSDEGPMESLREMPVWFMPEFVKHNMERYGGNWLVDFLRGYPDSPVMKWLIGESVR